MSGTEDLMSWEARLAAAEANLLEREQQALLGEPTPEELRAFAAEHDRLAAARDAVAEASDERARRRDAAGLVRDVRGSHRDQASRSYDKDSDWAAVDRFMSGGDRDLAAGDRGDSGDDRKRASQARQQAASDRHRASDDRELADRRTSDYEREIAGLRDALTTRLVIGQAEGLLMARHGISDDAAFRLLVRLSQNTHQKLRDVATRIATEHHSATRGDAGKR